MSDQPRSLSIASAIVALLWYALAAVAGVGVIPAVRMPYVLAALAVLHGLQAFLPALWGRAPAPVVEPPRVADAVVRVGIVLALLAGTAHASPLAPGVALPPGPEEIAAEAARPQQPPPQPVVYAADLAPMVRAPLLAQFPPLPAVVIPPPLSEAERIALVVRAAQAGLLEAQRGIQNAPILNSWSETRAGQVVLGCIAGAIVVTSAAGAVAGVLVVTR